MQPAALTIDPPIVNFFIKDLIKERKVIEMKRSILTSLFVVALSTLFVSGVMAQQTAAPTPPATTAPAPAKEKMERFRGKIEKVDPSTKEVVVQRRNETMTFSVGDNTKIMEGKKEASFGDLKAGERIFVRYTKEGDKLMAQAIRVAQPGAGKKKAAPEKS